MPTIAEPRDLFVSDLKSQLYVEQKLADQVLPELASEISNSEFKQSIDHHLEETKQHVANLERAFELLDEQPKGDKSHAFDGLVAQHEKVVKNIESDDVRDMFDAGAAAKTEHLEIAAYESMITAAQSLGETEIAGLLEQNLEQEKHALEQAKSVSEQLAGTTASV